MKLKNGSCGMNKKLNYEKAKKLFLLIIAMMLIISLALPLFQLF